MRGEIKERKRKGLLRRRTRRAGNFELRVTLPGELRADDVEASLAYGVLNMYLPKAQSKKHNKIKVTDGKREMRLLSPEINLSHKVNSDTTSLSREAQVRSTVVAAGYLGRRMSPPTTTSYLEST
ncbi:Hsp20/alpha crystallin family protein [Mycobacterium intermedium]